MKTTFKILILILSFSFLSLADDLENLEDCENLWSKGFDKITENLIEEEIAPFLMQNSVASEDLWSGFRPLSIVNRCKLMSICKIVQLANTSKFYENIKKPFAGKNALGGSKPGEEAFCLSELSLESFLEKLEIAPVEFIENCQFKNITSENIQKVFQICQNHAEIKVQIFDRAVQNLISKDTVRKTSGYFFGQISQFQKDFKDKIQDPVHSFVKNFNATISQICSFPHTDKE